jgi:dTMP kinase
MASGPGGRFVTIEGVEGAGKSTQARRLARWLERAGCAVRVTSEPDGSPLGPWVRRLLAERSPLDPLAECLLFATARAEHVRRVIRPALDAGLVVICDRFTDSTVAYQGHGRGVPLDVVQEVNRLSTDGLRPELTLVLDLDVAAGLGRARDRSSAPTHLDPFERLGLDFHERVRKGYRAIQEAEPDRVELVDAGRPAEAVAAAIRAVVGARLGVEAGE